MGFCATIIDYLSTNTFSVLRATYDHNGNIVLQSILQDDVSVLVQNDDTKKTQTKTWTVLEETRHEVKEMDTKILVRQSAKISILSSVGTQAKNIIEGYASEGSKQVRTTASEAEGSLKQARKALSDVPKIATEGMKSFWRIAKTPVALPARKPGKRPPRKITLFLIDTVRFGGTFAFIFSVLFVGMNYQSFWQIARAELALGGDITTEEALTKISKGSSLAGMIKNTGTSGDYNILKYLPSVGPLEDRLIIPKLGLNVPIVRPSMDALMKEDWKKFELDIQAALHDGVVHYPGSARAGQAGNFFLTGHSSYLPWDDGNYKDVFARLHELDLGDTYTVYYGGDRHTYRISKKYEVKPNNVSVLDQPTQQRIATLMTCTPIGTTLRRLIVQAEEINPVDGEVLKVGEKSIENVDSRFARLEALPI